MATTTMTLTTPPATSPPSNINILSLPAEIRLAIFEYVFEDNLLNTGFITSTTTPATNPVITTTLTTRTTLFPSGPFRPRSSSPPPPPPTGLILDESYTTHTLLAPLLTCRQFYHDAHLLALRRTAFLSTNLFLSTQIGERLSSLFTSKQLSSLRTIAFVADKRHFRKLIDWGTHPFNLTDLHLDTLTIVLHRSSFWHYLFDFTSDLVKLLRRLLGVRKLVFVRNNALVKGSFKTWYNRLIGLMMKVDHAERYERCLPVLETTWWDWSFDDEAQTFCLRAQEGKRGFMSEEQYLSKMQPLLEELKRNVEREEWNPDPRSWNGT